MTAISFQHVKKSYGANPVLEDVTFEVNEGDRVALIGRNGCGKSTLLQIVAGVQPADEGLVTVAKRARIGYLPQVPVDREGLTVYEVLSIGYRDLLACREQMLQLEAEMAALEHSAGSREMEKLLKTYAEQQERF
ncbi:MAG TPA: ATP-binding cassette domain-containing protein, partial [Symbiobacteriaceae bacterium]|nr:ATP-binding cassette domain-containing protein [Symbiobacteriaceae bacterium]